MSSVESPTRRSLRGQNEEERSMRQIRRANEKIRAVAEVTKDEEEPENNEDSWTCDCGNENRADKTRCNKCYKWKGRKRAKSPKKTRKKNTVKHKIEVVDSEDDSDYEEEATVAKSPARRGRSHKRMNYAEEEGGNDDEDDEESSVEVIPTPKRRGRSRGDGTAATNNDSGDDEPHTTSRRSRRVSKPPSKASRRSNSASKLTLKEVAVAQDPPSCKEKRERIERYFGGNTVKAERFVQFFKCKREDCMKYKQRGFEGYCRTHYNELHDEVKLAGEVEVASPAPKKLLRPICKFEEGCDKYSQHGKDSYCFRHFREQAQKVNNSTKKQTHRSSNRNRSMPSPCEDVPSPCEDVSPSRRGGRNKVAPVRHSSFLPNSNRCIVQGCTDYRLKGGGGHCASHFSGQIESPGRSGTSNRQTTASASAGSSRKGGTFCKIDGCSKNRRAGCDGCCKSHFSGSYPRASNRCIVLGCTEYKVRNGDGYCAGHAGVLHLPLKPDVTSIERSRSGRRRVDRADGQGEDDDWDAAGFDLCQVIGGSSRKKAKRNDSAATKVAQPTLFKKGDIVFVQERRLTGTNKQGGVARVMEIHQSHDEDGWGKCDVLYILGDRENGVDARYLTPHTVDDSTARTGRSSDDGRPVIVKQARTFSKAELIERTRCELLHGNDRWICIDCGIMVSSLTMACGMCGEKISFIPLEYPEFEDFVRGQRQKLNPQWLIKEEVSLNDCKWALFASPSHSPPANLDADCTSNQNEHDNDLILPHRSLITPYKYLLFEQLAICYRSEGDGFPGLGCKHCAGTDGHKRWFPNSQESLYQTTFTRSIANHLKLCQRCPDEVKQTVIAYEETKESDTSTKSCGAESITYLFLLRVITKKKCPSLTVVEDSDEHKIVTTSTLDAFLLCKVVPSLIQIESQLHNHDK
eukprot:scaffold1971_cov264-Alexandrium_tamarense.AAC.1